MPFRRSTHRRGRASGFRAFLASLLLLPLTLPLGAMGEEEPWYQIEVIVFEQRGMAGAAMPQRGLQLSYPADWQQLIDPDAPEHPLLADDEVAGLLILEDERQEPFIPLTVPRHGHIDLEALTVSPRLLPAEEPFHLLPSAERRLNAEARNLERSGNYRVLHHAAWRQPLGSRARSPWILVRGGEQYGEHHELEGSLRIYLERALFAQINLWKAGFSLQDRAADEEADWPPLPPWPARFGGETPLFETLAREAPARARPSRETERVGPQPEPLHALPALPTYSVDSIVALNRTHRLELGDTLYLDHPEFGMLIQVTRYQRDGAEAASDLAE